MVIGQIQDSRELESTEIDNWLVCKKRLEDIYDQEEIYWQQRSKMDWLWGC
jgi:hypothetical protein